MRRNASALLPILLPISYAFCINPSRNRNVALCASVENVEVENIETSHYALEKTPQKLSDVDQEVNGAFLKRLS